MHNHANSFVSGVVYLTPTHPGSQTVFMKSPGGTDFLFKNDHAGTTPERVQRRQVDQPGARARRPGAVPQLPHARRAAQPGRAPHHAVVQRHPDAARFMGLRRQVRAELARPALRPPVGASLLLMVASGFAGLGYQIVWTQQCALWLGHESAAVLAVVAAFFGGLAVGAFALGARIAAQRRDPCAGTPAASSSIALWSLLLTRRDAAVQRLGAAADRRASRRRRGNGRWRSRGTFVLLLPATAAMGATLPAMERIDRARRAASGARSIAALYAAQHVRRRRRRARRRVLVDSRASVSRAPPASASRSTCCARATALARVPGARPRSRRPARAPRPSRARAA